MYVFWKLLLTNIVDVLGILAGLGKHNMHSSEYLLDRCGDILLCCMQMYG